MLAEKAYESMVKYSKKNTYEYFEYIKKDNAGAKVSPKQGGDKKKEKK